MDCFCLAARYNNAKTMLQFKNSTVNEVHAAVYNTVYLRHLIEWIILDDIMFFACRLVEPSLSFLSAWTAWNSNKTSAFIICLVMTAITAGKHGKRFLAYFIFQFLFKLLVFSVQKWMGFFFGAQLRCQLIALILHPVQLDVQRRTQLLVLRCIGLIMEYR